MKYNIIELIDKYIFIKRGYSLCAHIIPFSIASLILLSLSVQSDNLLLRLASLLQTPNWTWLSSGFVTAISILIYVLKIKYDIQKSYLWPENEIIRITTTSFFYIGVCTLMAFGVFCTVNSGSNNSSISGIFASFMVASLSLTGIGWKGVSSFVKDIGLTMPDYSKARNAVTEISLILVELRSKPISTNRDRTKFLKIAEKLQTEIDENIQYEPEWSKTKIKQTSTILKELIEELNANFNDSNFEDLSPACRQQKEAKYKSFTKVIRQLYNQRPEWHFQ